MMIVRIVEGGVINLGSVSGTDSTPMGINAEANRAQRIYHENPLAMIVTATGVASFTGVGEVVVTQEGSNVIVSGTPHPPCNAVETINNLTGAVVVSGTNGNTVTTEGQTVTVSGFEDTFVSASGSLQNQIDTIASSNVDSINSEIGAITITGTGGVSSVTTANTVTLSGVPGGIDHDLLLNFNNNVHFTEASIDHTVLQNIGLNTHVQIDTHLSALSVSGTIVANDLSSHIVDPSAHHSRYTKEENDALLGSDGITIVSGSNTIGVQGFRTEFVATSGALQTDIDTHTADIAIHFTEASVDHAAIQNIGENTHPQIDIHLGLLATSGTVAAENLTVHASNTEAHHTRYTKEENDAIVAGGNVTVVSGLNTITISSTTEAVNALVGSDGITVISGSPADTISGFYTEFVSSSGSLQTQIDAVGSGNVDSINEEIGTITITGTSGVASITTANTVTLSGVPGAIDHDQLLNFDVLEHFIEGSIDHASIQNIGVNTHAQIDTNLSELSSSGTINSNNFTLHASNVSSHHTRYTKEENDAIVAGSNITIISGSNNISISSTTEPANALVGSDGITVTSGDPTDTVSGFYTEFVSASGSLSSDINLGIATHTAIANAHHARYDQSENNAIVAGNNITVVSGANSITISSAPAGAVSDALVGTDGITVISGSPTESETTVSGFRTEFVATSGSLQNQIDVISAGNVDSINSEIGAITITGTSGVSSVTTANTVTLSGVPGGIDHDLLLNFSADAHFIESSIDHLNIQSIGTNTHVQVDTHLSDLATSGTSLSNSFSTHTVNSAAHHTRYTKEENDALVGADGITVISGSNVITASGFREEFIAASGILSQHANLSNLNWLTAGHTIDTDLVMSDNSVTGINNLTFTDTAGAVAGIQNQNLLDKTIVEVVSGLWDFSTTPKLSALIQGSVPFIGVGGQVSEDNANLFWDDTNNRLGIGTNTPTAPLEVNGGVLVDGKLNLYPSQPGPSTALNYSPTYSIPAFVLLDSVINFSPILTYNSAIIQFSGVNMGPVIESIYSGAYVNAFYGFSMFGSGFSQTASVPPPEMFAINTKLRTIAQGAVTVGTSPLVTQIQIEQPVETKNTATWTVTEANAMSAKLSCKEATGSSLTLTEGNVLNIADSDTTGIPTFTTQNGIKIQNLAKATNNNAIWSNMSLGTNKRGLNFTGTARHDLGGVLSIFADDTNLLLGAGDDAGILYNGTTGNLDINPKLVGTGGVNLKGDLFFEGTGNGLPYGSMYNHDVPTTVVITAISTPVRVPSGFTAGQINLATFQNAREILVTMPGVYKVDWSISFSSSSNNQEVEGFTMLNNVIDQQSSAHRKISTATDTGAMGGTSILPLAANDVIALGVQNETSTGSIIIEHANLSFVMVGG